jgi:hypothetical protein
MAAKRDSSFSSFLVDEGNRRGHDLCLAVSQADPISPLPLILVGEPGCGKTHLLYATANRLRATAGHAAILFVSPGAWGEDLERIIADPAPIDMARHAVLLVDDLQGFAAKYEPIARLIEIFLENDHYVVLATEAHPDRLSGVPAKLRRQLKGGQIVEIAAGEARRSLETIEARLRGQQAEAIARLEQRVREMEAESPEAAAARRRSRAGEMEQARRESAEAREEAEHLRAEMALLKVSAREAGQFRARVQELEGQLVERAKQPAPAPAEDEDAIKRKLVEARFDAQKAREEARGMLERAQGLLKELHQNRSTFEEAQRERERQRGEILKLEAVFRGERATALEGPGAAEESAPLEPPALPAAPAETTALQDEIHRLQEGLVRARSERDTMKSHLAHVREELDETRRDNDRVRAESLKERTEREEHVRELEAALIARHGEVEGLREAHKMLTGEVETLRTQVADGASVVERLIALLGGAGPAAEASSETADKVGVREPDPIVRADFGESLRLAPKRSAGLHHVEELRGAAGPGFPQTLPPLDDTDEGGPFYRGAGKTA